MNEPEWLVMINYMQDIRLFSHLLNKKSKPGNILSKDELDLLSNLILNDELITPIILSKRMGVSKPLVSRLIEQLNQKQLLTKIPSSNDKRSYSLEITALGKKHLDEFYTYYLQPIYQLKNTLSSDEFNDLIYLIKKANNLIERK